MKGVVISTAEQKRIAVVTGGNRGIGLEICRQLALNGAIVILTARDEKKGAEVVAMLRESGCSDVVFHQLDVTDPSSIASLADYVASQFARLDILVNNAGIFGVLIDDNVFKAGRPLDHEEDEDTGDIPRWIKENSQETYEMAKECIKANYYGSIRVTEALLPLLQSSTMARIVNISSSIGKLRFIPSESVKQKLSDVECLKEETLDELVKQFLEDFEEGQLSAHGWPTSAAAYKVSKALLNAYARILAREHPTICTNCVCPGYTKTDLNWNTGILTAEEAAKGPVMLATLSDGSPSGLFYDQKELSSF